MLKEKPYLAYLRPVSLKMEAKCKLTKKESRKLQIKRGRKTYPIEVVKAITIKMMFHMVLKHRFLLIPFPYLNCDDINTEKKNQKIKLSHKHTKLQKIYRSLSVLSWKVYCVL